MDFNAAIFDLDGTILDSMDVWEHIDIQFLKKRNLPVPDNYVTEICARSFEEAAQYTIDLFGLQETVEGIIEEWNNMAVEEYRNHVGLLPYVMPPFYFIHILYAYMTPILNNHTLFL